MSKEAKKVRKWCREQAFNLRDELNRLPFFQRLIIAIKIIFRRY